VTERALDRATAAALIEAAAFGGAAHGRAPRIGIEAELIAVDADTRSVASFTRRVVPVVRRHAARAGWTEVATAKGAPRFATPGGGMLTFEPGGQFEYATPPFARAGDLLENVRLVVPPLVAAAADAGIDLIGVGIDPCNGLEAAPLQIDAERYRCMDAYFGTIGQAGARMMRQTASIQISIDSGSDSARSWRMLNALAPVITAMFANSREYAGVDTGHASYRASTWRQLDPSRTGLAWQDDNPVHGYIAFALAANAVFLRGADGEYRPFEDWIARGAASAASLETHLTTLFPEVRPRGYFELRSIDALPPAAYAAPVLLLAGLTSTDAVVDQACEVLGMPDPGLLNRAATCGLRDPLLASMARDLVHLAVSACRSMQPDVTAHLDTALDFFERYTLRGRCPADDARAGLIATAA
jgi:glutamate--cysteine ligase